MFSFRVSRKSIPLEAYGDERLHNARGLNSVCFTMKGVANSGMVAFRGVA